MKWIVLLAGLALLPAALAGAASEESQEDGGATPCAVDTTGFALVLGGGGARGLAHIGVLEVLEELGMRPSLIVGTSMGAVVGALYATGHDAATIDALAHDIRWLELYLYRDVGVRDALSQARGVAPHVLALRLDHLPPAPMAGVSHGQAVETLLGSLTADATFAAGSDFDCLPIPYRCTTVDAEAAELVVYDRGNLSRVAKASGTIPVVFHPVRYEGRQLYDGGLVNNLPVSVARELGFSRIVAVDVSNVYLPLKHPLDDTWAAWFRTIQLGQITQNEREALPGEVFLRPDVRQFRGMAFWSYEAIHDAGRAAADTARVRLAALRDRCGPVATRPLPPVGNHSVELASLNVEGNGNLSETSILKGLGIAEGDVLTLPALWDRADRLTRTGAVSNTWLSIQRRGDGRADVTVHVEDGREARLELGAHHLTDDGSAALVRARPLAKADAAAEWRIGTQDHAVRGWWRQRVVGGPGNDLGLQLRAGWRKERLEDYTRGEAGPRWVFRRRSLELAAAWRPWLDRPVRLTVAAGGEDMDTSREDGDGRLRSRDLWRGLRLRLDVGLPAGRVFFEPRRLHVEWTRALEGLGATGEFGVVQVGADLPVHLGRVNGAWRGRWITGSEDRPLALWGRGGGPAGWAGLRRDEILAPHLLWHRLEGSVGLGLGVSLHAALAQGWAHPRSLADALPLWGGILELGAETPFGPTRAGWAIAEDRRGYVTLRLGYEF